MIIRYELENLSAAKTKIHDFSSSRKAGFENPFNWLPCGKIRVKPRRQVSFKPKLNTPRKAKKKNEKKKNWRCWESNPE
jgi:hypothetical protein